MKRFILILIAVIYVSCIVYNGITEEERFKNDSLYYELLNTSIDDINRINN